MYVCLCVCVHECTYDVCRKASYEIYIAKNSLYTAANKNNKPPFVGAFLYLIVHECVPNHAFYRRVIVSSRTRRADAGEY